MDNNLECYEKCLTLLQRKETMKAHIAALTKVQIETVDTSFKELLEKLCISMVQSYNMADSKSRTKLIGMDVRGVVVNPLFQYCTQKMADQKPAWQIEAERNGWTGPVTTETENG